MPENRSIAVERLDPSRLPVAKNHDAFSDFDDLLAEAPVVSPWEHRAQDAPVFVPDYELLCRLLSVPLAAGDKTQSGRFAKAIDAWFAHELRRSGFGADEVWPRASRPRVISQDVMALLAKLPTRLAEEVGELLVNRGLGAADARILGRAYVKQVDVAIARWDRGPELILSTKAMSSSFGKNLSNRFEEAYGDAGNLRARYPLSAVGFAFLQRGSIVRDEPGAFTRTMDMMRKLRDRGDGNGYTATALILIDWENDDPAATARFVEDAVPDDISVPQFMRSVIETILEATPVDEHVRVRELYENRSLPVQESDPVLPQT